MTAVKLDEPLSILVLLGLTLPEVSEGDLAKIRAAAPGSTVKVAPRVGDAIDMADDVEVILGFLPETLFQAAPRLRWVHAIASGVDMFLYPAMRGSDVVLTGEKGLVGGHLADTGFGLLLALTRQIATAIRLGSSSWQERETMRRKEIELEGLTMGIVGFGGTGRAMARRAVAFGMRVLALDEQPVPASDGRGRGVGTGASGGIAGGLRCGCDLLSAHGGDAADVQRGNLRRPEARCAAGQRHPR